MRSTIIYLHGMLMTFRCHAVARDTTILEVRRLPRRREHAPHVRRHDVGGCIPKGVNGYILYTEFMVAFPISIPGTIYVVTVPVVAKMFRDTVSKPGRLLVLSMVVFWTSLMSTLTAMALFLATILKGELLRYLSVSFLRYIITSISLLSLVVIPVVIIEAAYLLFQFKFYRPYRSLFLFLHLALLVMTLAGVGTFYLPF